MERTTASTRRRLLSPGAWAGLVVACLAVGWLLYTFLQELTPARTQRLGDLEISLYSTLTGRPRLGVNQFEVKLRDLQGQPVSQAHVAVRYALDGTGSASVTDTRFEGYGIFSVVLNFPEAGDWHATVLVGRPGLPELSAPFIIRVE
jgi:hypothetical protein